MTRLRTSLAAITIASIALFMQAADAAPRASMPATRTIILVRHAHYVERPGSPLGEGLSPRGFEQARITGRHLAQVTPRLDAIYASPMTRAWQTAKTISSFFPRVPFEVVDDLAECTPPAEGEKPAPDARQCASTLDRLFAQRFVPAQGQPRTELLVCHGNVTGYLVSRALGDDPEHWRKYAVGHASLTVIRVFADGSVKVIAVGDRRHLADARPALKAPVTRRAPSSFRSSFRGTRGGETVLAPVR